MLLQAKGIHKYYSNGKERLHILKDVSLSIAQGEIAAVLGPSGAGKSTLLHILGGLDSPESGEVFFEGQDISSFSDRESADFRNKAVGFVFQFYHLLPEFNLLENIMMPALIGRQSPVVSLQSREKAKELLKEVGLSHRVRHLPNQLSGGEQQRAAIARALINEPKVLLCDEPTGNLDSENSKQIIQTLKRLNREKKMTIIMVTHNLDLTDFASKVYHIKDGELVHCAPSLTLPTRGREL